MEKTLQGTSVLLFGGQKYIAPPPVAQLGFESNRQAHTLAVDAIDTPATALTQRNTAPSSATMQTSIPTVFTLAAGEHGFVQKHDADGLCVTCGTGAGNSSFEFGIQECTAKADGSGASITIENNRNIDPVRFPSQLQSNRRTTHGKHLRP